MSANLLAILLTVVGGSFIAIQAPTNAVLARASGSVLLAALISFAVGTCALLVAWAATDRTARMAAVPWWAWAGGLYGAFFVTVAAFAAPRLGLAVMLTLMIASQLGAALLIDHFGLLGIARAPATLGRVAGVALVLGGVLLVRRG